MSKPAFQRQTPSDASGCGKFYRLTVEYDPDDGPVAITDEQVTSASPNAVRLEGAYQPHICLTRREAKWLRDVLNELIPVLDENEDLP